jgi:signal transduction histidine kinase
MIEPGLLAGDGRATRWPPWWREALLVVVAAFAQIVIPAIAHRHGAEGSYGVAGITLMALAAAALPFRHRFPVGAYLVVYGTTLAYWSLDYARGPIFVSLIVVLGHLVLIGRRRLAIAGLVVGYLTFPWVGHLIGRTDWPDVGFLVGLAAWLIALFSIAETIRSRRERAEEIARSHAEALRRRATDERMRIARELHDVVAHNMSLISIQAGVALHLLDERPEQARESLATIKEASKEALVELRSILGVLRQVDEVGDDEGAPRSPVPSLQRLDDLVDRARAAGIDVRVELDAGLGDLDRLPRQVDLAAFRIVQESLTNVAKHSDDPAAVVRIHADDGGLAVDVLDDGSGHGGPAAAALPGPGSGITGMRERAVSVGGRLDAGPRPGRGFAVRAWLPLGSADDAAAGTDTEAPRPGGPVVDPPPARGWLSRGGGVDAGGAGAEPVDPTGVDEARSAT